MGQVVHAYVIRGFSAIFPVASSFASSTFRWTNDVSKCGFRYVRYASNEMAWNDITGKMVMFKSLAYATDTHSQRTSQPTTIIKCMLYV